MVIDVHAHFWTDAYLDKIAALGKTDTAAQRGRAAGDGAELEDRLALMDRAGVDMQVLSASPQLPHSGQLRQHQRPGPADADRVLSANAQALFGRPDP